MAFQFSLRALLRLRQSQEKQEELLFRQACAQVDLLHERIQATTRTLAELNQCEQKMLHAGLRSAQLHFHQLSRSALQETERGLERQLMEAEITRAARQIEFQKARQQREVMETLRHQQSQMYLRQEARREQRQLDEFYLLHQFRQNRS